MTNYILIRSQVITMKQLKKIKLINWHLFLNQTITLSGNALLSGENGVGKSTLLDALQYVLTGGKAKFNSAANQQAKRDLEGYVRGKLGREGKTYLRSQDVVTHVALEFFDTETNSLFIIGVIIEINKNRRMYERFYIVHDTEILDDLFFKTSFIRGYRLFKQGLIEAQKKFSFYETKEQTRSAFLKVLEINNERYLDLITKALAFRPIAELNKFVYDFLLNQKDISLEELRQSVNSYRDFEILLEEIKEKEKQLGAINTLYVDYLSLLDKSDILNRLHNYSKYQLQLHHKTIIEKQIKQLKQSYQDTETEINGVGIEIKKINTDIDELKQYLHDSPYKYYKDLDLKLKSIKQKIAVKEKTVCDFKEIMIAEEHILDFVYKGEFVKKGFIFSSQIDEAKLLNYLHEIKKMYEQISIRLYSEGLDLKKSLTENIQKREEIVQEINSLHKNQLSFDKRLLRLKSLIEKSISQLIKRNYHVYALCELLEIRDETWRNAVEGYLGNRRFDLIVEPEYFDYALKVSEKARKENLYGIGIVNTKALKGSEIKPNSLAEKVKANSFLSKNYLNLLLGRIICCENVEELKKYPQAITKTGIVYQNHTARLINKFIYEIPYIGINAIKIRLNNITGIKNNIDNTINKINADINEKEFKLKKIKANQLDYLIGNYQVVNELISLKQSLELNINKQKGFKLGSELKEIKQELNEQESFLHKLEQDKNRLLVKLGKLSSEIDNKEAQIESTKFDNEVNTDTLVISYYEDLMKQFNNINKVLEQCHDETKITENKIKDLKVTILTKMNQYKLNYQVPYDTTLEDIEAYLAELKQIKTYELVKYENKASEARKKCENAFKEQFIYQLRENIFNAQQELKYLNQALKREKFGQDEYEFIYQPSNNQEYKQYYEVIMNEINYELPLFEEGINEQNKIILCQLFDKLVADEAYELVTAYCDYRNYMSYDIKITDESGEVTYFSKVNREKSGGETQTPFYVVIGASFEQLISHKKQNSPACFVMFDEAFNNMDEGRIQAMMNFYQQLDIQLMIAVPPGRIEVIIPYVNTTLIVMKQDDKSFVETFTYQSG